LFHGPTKAFKDVGARFMARLVPCLRGGEDASLTVLVATSGDTGGAVASAFHRQAGIRVVVLFPEGGVSEYQRRQMTTLGGNVRALSVRGSFDDCQTMVKAAFRDPAVRVRHSLTSANSINVARLLPQALYYVLAASLLPRARGEWPEAPPHFVVPSGNLGNLCAGLLAARAGVPTSGFTAAVNANRAFAEFLAGGQFRPRPSVATRSSAMDVGAPSNLERIRWLFGGDDSALRRAVQGESVDDMAAARCIRIVFEEHGYLLDPHSAVGFEAARRRALGAGLPVVVLATAHPGKFPTAVEAAIGCPMPEPARLHAADQDKEYMTRIHATKAALVDALDAEPA
jgi:threonine synthase